MRCQSEATSLYPGDRRPENVIDPARSGRQHDQPIKSQRHPAGLRHQRERCQEFFVERIARSVDALLLRHLLLQPPTLLGRIRELAEAVGKLHSADIELEALGKSGIALQRPGQRRLYSGILIENGRTSVPQKRLDTFDENAAENIPPAVIGSKAHPRPAGRCRTDAGWARRQHFVESNTGMPAERLADGEPIGSGERISGPAAPREPAAAGEGPRN